MSEIEIFRQSTPANYNHTVVRHNKIQLLLRPFKGSGTLRERDETKWFPVEFLIYHDERNKLHSFAHVRREDGADIPDGHYVFLDDMGERSSRWRKWKGKWQYGWRLKPNK
jgi:hypothetical protein